MTRTVGIEEELFLVDPQTRQVSTRAHEVLASLSSAQGGGGIDQEIFRHQLETRTEPVTDLADARRQLVAARRTAAAAAEAHGLALAVTGTLPTGGDLAFVTPEDRYRDMVETYGAIARGAGTCGMHVHVAIDSDEGGVAALDRIARWLPVLLAISANSPFHQGVDSGHASWRSRLWLQWPSAGPTERFGDLEGYRRACRFLIDSGAARDVGMLYLDARLSESHPTLEVRVADACTDPDDAVLVAALVRALVSTPELEDPPWRTEQLRAAHWRAARFGCAGSLVDPRDGELRGAREVLAGLVGAVADALDDAGDEGLVRDGVERVLAGTGATRQHARFERSGELASVVDDLVTRTAAAAVH